MALKSKFHLPNAVLVNADLWSISNSLKDILIYVDSHRSTDQSQKLSIKDIASLLSLTMRVLGKFSPIINLLTALALGRTVYNLWNQDNMMVVPTTRKMKNEYEGKLVEQAVDPAQDTSTTSTTTTTTSTGADAAPASINYHFSYFPHMLKGHQYFLPAYAMNRPAVQSFLRGQYYEPQTHCMMEKLLGRFPGR